MGCTVGCDERSAGTIDSMSNLGVLSRLSALFECANFLPLLAPIASCVDRFALEEELDADALLPPSSHPFGSRLTAGEGG